MSEHTTDSRRPNVRTLSGRGVVAAMFALGITATVFLWIYWTVRMTPFMPLQAALEQRFPDSAPRAEGGTIKDSGETVLQVVLRSDFDPRDQSADGQARIEERLTETRRLSMELAELESYEILAVHLYYPRKEQGISQETFFRDVATWKPLDAEKLKGMSPDPRRVPLPATDASQSDQ